MNRPTKQELVELLFECQTGKRSCRATADKILIMFPEAPEKTFPTRVPGPEDGDNPYQDPLP